MLESLMTRKKDTGMLGCADYIEADYHWTGATNALDHKHLAFLILKGLVMIPKYVLTNSETKQGSV